MDSIPISDFKARCIAVLKEVQRTRRPLVVTHRGRPIARVEPVPESVEKRRLGALRHLGRVEGDLVPPAFEDEWETEE